MIIINKKIRNNFILSGVTVFLTIFSSFETFANPPSCPTAGDMSDGIVFERVNVNGNKFVYLHRRVSKDIVWRSWDLVKKGRHHKWTSSSWHSIYQNGLFLVGVVKKDSKKPSVPKFIQDASNFFPVRIGARKKIEFIRHDIDGMKAPRKVTKEYLVQSSDVYNIGDCSYEVYRIKMVESGIDTRGRKYSNTDNFLYSTELSTILWENVLKAGLGWPDGHTLVRKRKDGDRFLSPLSADNPKSKFDIEVPKNIRDFMLEAFVNTEKK